MKKVAIIGAGNVGSTLAMRVVENDLADVALLDIVEGLPQGKAIDIQDASPIMGHDNKILGTSDYKDIEGSSCIVITAGFPRKPGMSREDLIDKNAPIIKNVADNIRKYCNEPIVIVVTNPLDIMCYYMYKISGLSKSKVIGMAGTLDTARFINLIAEELNVPRKTIETCVLGSHGDTMVPVISKTSVNKKPISEIMPGDKLKRLVDKTKNRGAEVVSLLKSGSAYYSPSAGVFEMLKAIKENSHKVLCVSTLLEGEYGISDCFIGVPAKLGAGGIEKIIEFDLTKEELGVLKDSAEKTKKALKYLKSL